MAWYIQSLIAFRADCRRGNAFWRLAMVGGFGDSVDGLIGSEELTQYAHPVQLQREIVFSSSTWAAIATAREYGNRVSSLVVVMVEVTDGGGWCS